MYVLILITCTVVAIKLYFGVIYPIVRVIHRRKKEKRQSTALARGIEIATRLKAHQSKKTQSTNSNSRNKPPSLIVGIPTFRNGLKVMEHLEIEDLLFWNDPETGNTNVSSKNSPHIYRTAFVKDGVEPMLKELLEAAPVMYQQLSLQYTGLQTLINVMDMLPNSVEMSKLYELLIQLQNGCLLAQLVAQKGINQVSRTLNLNSKLS